VAWLFSGDVCGDLETSGRKDQKQLMKFMMMRESSDLTLARGARGGTDSLVV
jgi:hypothetical protein